MPVLVIIVIILALCLVASHINLRPVEEEI